MKACPADYRKYPNFVRQLQNYAADYNRMTEDIQNLEREGRAFVIQSETPLEIGRMSHDQSEIQKAYIRGRDDAQKKLTAVNQWLQAER